MQKSAIQYTLKLIIVTTLERQKNIRIWPTGKIDGKSFGPNLRVRNEARFSCIVERENVESCMFILSKVAPVKQSAMNVLISTIVTVSLSHAISMAYDRTIQIYSWNLQVWPQLAAIGTFICNKRTYLQVEEKALLHSVEVQFLLIQSRQSVEQSSK